MTMPLFGSLSLGSSDGLFGVGCVSIVMVIVLPLVYTQHILRRFKIGRTNFEEKTESVSKDMR